MPAFMQQKTVQAWNKATITLQIAVSFPLGSHVVGTVATHEVNESKSSGTTSVITEYVQPQITDYKVLQVA